MKYCRTFLLAWIGLLTLAGAAYSDETGVANSFRNPLMLDMTLWLPERLPVARIRYGNDSPLQFGDLRLPASAPPEAGYPVVVFVHGGGWTADWTKDYSAPFVEALTQAGYATWDLEFRRLGNQGGGYPGTFRDVGAGTDHLGQLAADYPLDLSRVVVMGHSSGGHLALWIAGRRNLPISSSLRANNPLPLAGVVSLAGVNDLKRSLELGDRKDVLTLSGIENPADADARFAETSPASLLPLGVPQSLIVGTRDSAWRIAMTREYAAVARAAGDAVDLLVPDGANHFDVVDPGGPAIALVTQAVARLLSHDAHVEPDEIQ